MAKKVQYTREVEGWLNVIADYDKEYKQWETRTKKIVKRYRDERVTVNVGRKYPILWSNLQTLIPAAYAKVPDPEVSRRFSDDDEVGRVASTILKRALEFEMKHYPDFNESALQCITDRFLGGRGTPWIRYEAEFEKQHWVEPSLDPNLAGDITEDDDDYEERGEMLDVIVDEHAPVDYIHWQDFGHNVCRTWSEVNVVWKRVYLDRDELIDRFGEELGRKIPLDTSPTDNLTGKKTHTERKAMIYELWDKQSKKVYWVSKSHGEVLDEKDDPLELENFFPCPKPLYGTITSDTLVPVPDFIYYQDQAESLDNLQEKIHDLVKSLKIHGVYDATIPELKRLFTEAGNTNLIPVTNWAAFAEKNGLKGAIDIVDITMLSTALNEAFAAQKALKDEISYITGIADIVKGLGDAGETATAQGIKGNYVGLRLNCSQGQIAYFLSEVIRIKAQVICGYNEKTISEIACIDQMSDADKQLVPQALQMLKSAPLRTFRIEVDADSLVNIDEQQERADRVEFLTAFSNAVEKAVPMVTQVPQTAPIILELLKYGVGAYKGANAVEGQIDAALDSMKVWIQQQASQPKPDPEMMKIQAQTQMEDKKLQGQMALEEKKADLAVHVEQQKQYYQQQQIDQQKQAENAQTAFEMQMAAHKDMLETQYDAQNKAMEESFNRWKAELEAATKIITASIAAGAQTNAARKADNEISRDLQ